MEKLATSTTVIFALFSVILFVARTTNAIEKMIEIDDGHFVTFYKSLFDFFLGVTLLTFQIQLIRIRCPSRSKR